MYFCFCRQQQQQQKPELKFIDANFFKTFQAKFSYRRILTGTSDKKPKYCLSFLVVLKTYVSVSWNKTYIFAGSVNSSRNNCFVLFSLYSFKKLFSIKTLTSWLVPYWNQSNDFANQLIGFYMIRVFTEGFFNRL